MSAREVSRLAAGSFPRLASCADSPIPKWREAHASPCGTKIAARSHEPRRNRGQWRSTTTDRHLQQHVQKALDWEPSIDAADIGVSVEGGVVTLRGDVRTYSDGATAERVALAVYGESFAT
jgi:hypothetical protein